MKAYYFSYRHWVSGFDIFQRVELEFLTTADLNPTEFEELHSNLILGDAKELTQPISVQKGTNPTRFNVPKIRLNPTPHTGNVIQKILVNRPLIIIGHGAQKSDFFSMSRIYGSFLPVHGEYLFVSDNNVIIHLRAEDTAYYLTHRRSSFSERTNKQIGSTHYLFSNSTGIPNHTLSGDYGPHYIITNLYTAIQFQESNIPTSYERFADIQNAAENCDTVFVSRGRTDLKNIVAYLFNTFGLIYTDIRILCCRQMVGQIGSHQQFSTVQSITRICNEEDHPNKYYLEIETRVNLLDELLSKLLTAPQTTFDERWSRLEKTVEILDRELLFYIKRYLYMLSINIIPNLSRFNPLIPKIQALFDYYGGMMSFYTDQTSPESLAKTSAGFTDDKLDEAAYTFDRYITLALFLSNGRTDHARTLIDNQIDDWIKEILSRQDPASYPIQTSPSSPFGESPPSPFEDADDPTEENYEALLEVITTIYNDLSRLNLKDFAKQYDFWDRDNDHS